MSNELSQSITSQSFKLSAQYLYARSSQTAVSYQSVHRPEHGHDRRRVGDDDQVNLSPAARHTRRLEHRSGHGDDNPFSALDKLTNQLLRTMMRAFTGREFNLLDPSRSGAPTAASPPQPPLDSATLSAAETGTPPAADSIPPGTTLVDGTPAPVISPNPLAPLYRSAFAEFYQVQSFSFSASGTVNTEDAQQVGISVHFSYSQQLYAAVGGSVTTADGNTAGASSPLNANFEGYAAQLSQTSFSFELDLNGQPAQNSAPAPAVAGTVATPPGPATTASGEVKNELLQKLDKLFERLQIWLRHSNGERQLIALGLNSTSALYMGHLTKPAETGSTA